MSVRADGIVTQSDTKTGRRAMCGVQHCRGELARLDDHGVLRWASRYFEPSSRVPGLVEIGHQGMLRVYRQNGYKRGDNVRLGATAEAGAAVKCAHCGFVQRLAMPSGQPATRS